MQSKNYNKGFISIGIILAIILALLVVGGGGYYLIHKNEVEQKNPEQNKIDEFTKIEASTDYTPEQSNNTIEAKNTSSEKATYTNTTYGFSVEYPKIYIYKSEGPSSASCSVTDKVNADGTSQGHNLEVPMISGAKLPVSFAGTPESVRGSIVFGGGVAYTVSSECNPLGLVSIDVIKKSKNFSLSAYLAGEVKTTNKGFEGSATGGGASLVYVKVNGQSIPVIRSIDGSAVINTDDVYYFDGGDYIYTLQHSYGQGEFTPENIKYAQGNWERYQLENDIIASFKIIPKASTKTNATILGKINICENAGTYPVYPGHQDPKCTPTPIINAQVIIFTDPHGTYDDAIAVTNTDNKGAFTLRVPAGSYVIKYIQSVPDGINYGEQKVTVATGETRNITYTSTAGPTVY